MIITFQEKALVTNAWDMVLLDVVGEKVEIKMAWALRLTKNQKKLKKWLSAVSSKYLDKLTTGFRGNATKSDTVE